MRNPFIKPRPNPKRAEPRRVRGRVRLNGEDMTELRRQAFERSGGFCEAWKENHTGHFQVRCGQPITWETMELSHDRHAANKSDTLETVKASCKDCHQVGKHNPKPCPRKAGRTMTIKEANDYWHGQKCFCEKWKAARTSFCRECWLKLSDQLRHDLDNALGKDYLRALADSETAILAWKPEEERVG